MNKRVHEVDVKDFDRTHAVNERGVWLSCKYELAQMMAQEPREANARGDRTRGWIVNAASMLGLVALPFGNSYVPGKFWHLGWQLALALHTDVSQLNMPWWE